MVPQIQMLEPPGLTILNFCVVGLNEDRSLQKKGG